MQDNDGPSNRSSSTPWWSPILAALIATVGTLWVAQISADRSLWQRANEDEIQRHQRSLDEFYGPFMRLLDVTFLLSQDLRYRLNDPDYRMLLRLADPRWLPGMSSGDKVIVEEVIANDVQLENLILEKSGGRVDEEVTEYLSHAVAHFRMIRRAMKGDFGLDDVEMLKPYVFPEMLRDVVKAQSDHIARRITALRKAPRKAPPPYEAFQLSPEAKAKLPSWPNPARPPVQSPTVG